ncbi:MAG: Membrane transport protein [bacterium ADurb.Bin429]|nr:MAG: Membrane transport protein [bacterium ADurb.Bin429]
MSDWLTVLLIIGAMFMVIVVGWEARRRKMLTAETTSTLSRLVVDLTIPALVFTQMLRTVDRPSLATNWYIPLLGAGIIAVSLLVALPFAPLFTNRASRPTFLFLIAVANWIYLPLPIVEALYGADGVRAVLLMNVGAQMILWTLGVWTLRGGKPDLESLKNLILNPGLIATALGIALALLVPNTASWFTPDGMKSVNPVLMAMLMVGSLTIPLSLLVTGAQLGGLDLSDHRPSPPLNGVVLLRLLLAPAIVIGLVWFVDMLGFALPEVPRMVTYIIASMPVAISCSIFTERFGGDTPLAARAIFLTTLLSIVTVPAIFFLVTRWHI